MKAKSKITIHSLPLVKFDQYLRVSNADYLFTLAIMVKPQVWSVRQYYNSLMLHYRYVSDECARSFNKRMVAYVKAYIASEYVIRGFRCDDGSPKSASMSGEVIVVLEKYKIADPEVSFYATENTVFH
jgi:hypothetical protein